MKVCVLGAGSWGTALSLVLHGRGEDVTLWSRSQGKLDGIRTAGENRTFLPGVAVPGDLKLTCDLAECVPDAEAVVFSVPSRATAPLAKEVAGLTRQSGAGSAGAKDAGKTGAPLIVLTAKGFEPESRRRLSEAVGDSLPRERVAVLAGPSHAEEVARRVPTTVVAASYERAAAEETQHLFSTDRFRVYTNHDIIGVETATALKNVIALAAGICDGLGFGDNAKGALLTRGLAEMSRLGVELGGDPATFAGLAGMGDLITTCISPHSRNRSFGEAIGRGKSAEEAERASVMVVEGVGTTKIAAELAREHDIEMPITFEVESVLLRGKKPMDAMADLMTRDLKAEVW
ncbi:MAG: NAD(P)-dependent glycerol-3-phosphate dehydrogenase [Gemmatimonadetes bacterium]|nr:NAD(P)-dependent glycerol-3-phosphate dehydrogenase [Gemmatimonadota bacterium]